MSTETQAIPDEFMKAADRAANSCFSGTSIRSRQGKLAIAKAINDAVMAERERCAKIADDAAAGRDWQRSDANAHNDKRAARDFETMKFEAIEIASTIRLPIPAAPKAEG